MLFSCAYFNPPPSPPAGNESHHPAIGEPMRDRLGLAKPLATSALGFRIFGLRPNRAQSVPTLRP